MHVHEYMFRSARGVTLSLQRWTGQPILIVNTVANTAGASVAGAQAREVFGEVADRGGDNPDNAAWFERVPDLLDK